ncbi:MULTISPECIES: hypothetical protein [unclassified Paenibacillus]|uniref:hypothetical protein n=1 Tax=unclassified Paenibacillus TaxID=185978 RepID=UPI0030F7D369
MALTNAELQTDIQRLAETIRAIRVRQGLPADPLPLPRTVEEPLAGALIKRLEPFRAIAVKYASLLADGRIAHVDISKLERYREYGRMLIYARGIWSSFYGTAVNGIFQQLDKISAAVESGEAAEVDTNRMMRTFHLLLETFMKADGNSWDMFTAYGGYSDERRAAEAELKRLIADDEAFQTAYDEALAQLPTKEEDDLYE